MKHKQKEAVIENLKRFPVIQFACERSGVSRATFYRWRSEDEEFKKLAEQAIAEGEAFITDMTESQLIGLIKDKNFHAIQLWLRHHHPKYNNRIEITTEIKNTNELTPEQKALIKKALSLAALPDPGEYKKENEQ